MGNSTHFRLADKSDDQAIRELFRSSPMKGNMALSYDLAPSFFSALQAQGYNPHVVVAEKNNSLLACGTALQRKAYVNGETCEIGYLGGLRIGHGSRSSTILARGYGFFKEINDTVMKVPFYLSSVAEDNHAAIKILTSGRAGLPSYHELGRYMTFAIPAAKINISRGAGRNLKIVKGSSMPFREILHFLNCEGRRKQFFPVLTEKDFSSPHGQFNTISHDDFLIACDRRGIIGTLALWNQDSFRRIILEGYGGAIKGVKSLSSLISKTGIPDFLPDPGKPISIRMASCILVKDDNQEIFSSLLNSALEETMRAGSRFLLVGLPVHDPLVKCIRTPIKLRYASRIYIVSWDSEYKINGHLNFNKNFFLDLGTL